MARCLLSPSSVDFKLADYNAQTFLDEIVKERGYETVYEVKRWHDLKRMGIVKAKISEVKGVTVADKFLLWPIPLSEMNYNKALDPVSRSKSWLLICKIASFTACPYQ